MKITTRTTLADIVEQNQSAPKPNTWTKAEVAGYASTKREAERLASEANKEEK